MSEWSTTDIIAAFTFVVFVVTLVAAAIAGWFERKGRIRTLKDLRR